MSKFWKVVLVIGLIALSGAFWYFLFTYAPTTDTYSDEYYAEDLSISPWSEDPSCNVAGINLHGELMTYVPYADQDYDYASAEYLWWLLDEADKSKGIQAVIFEIDSYGGSPVAAEELGNKIKNMQKPVMVVVRGAAVSAGYWVASAGDRVFASELSDIGGIGVTMSYLDESKINEKEGFTWNSLSTGKFKDSGSAQKALTAEERALFERDLGIIFDKFKSVVAENRGLGSDKVAELADGSTMLGTMAVQNGLVDAIGSVPDAEEYLKTKLTIEPETCW